MNVLAVVAQHRRSHAFDKDLHVRVNFSTPDLLERGVNDGIFEALKEFHFSRSAISGFRLDPPVVFHGSCTREYLIFTLAQLYQVYRPLWLRFVFKLLMNEITED